MPAWLTAAIAASLALTTWACINRARAAARVHALENAHRGDEARYRSTLAAFSDMVAALERSQRENEALAARLIVAQEQERGRIGRDLHDDVGQKLALLSIELDRLQAPGRLSRLVGEIAQDVHDLSHELHPSKLETLGLITAIRSLCRDMSRKYGIAIEFRHKGGPRELALEVSLHLYRIVQEALHNIVKHSGAKEALVEVDVALDTFDLRIADHGCGFFPALDGQDGLGLASIRERVRIVGGRFAIHSSPGMGTRLGVRLEFHHATDWNRTRISSFSRAEIA